ncbi:MAG: ABC transporter ATP-binding protein, partial [Planctomycetota bacterium]
MGLHRRSSRQLFREYLGVLRGRGSAHRLPFSAERRRGRRQRGGLQLLAEFLRLLRGQYAALAYALGTLTLATCLALVPPATTKVVVDNVLGDRPLAEPFVRLLRRVGISAADRGSLLVACVLVVIVASMLRVAIHLSGRWVATRLTKRVQIRVRKRLFEHVIRLPLYRVQQLRSGGVASVLREDGGAVGELVFAMLYNPWRAVVQLVGSLVILAWVDWRLLLGTLGLLPALYLAHRTWVRRIRPLYRDIRAQREHIDGHATEVFAGIRVVRGFARERAETWRYVRNTNLMTRQELFVWWWSRILEAVWEALIPLGSAALLLYGGWRVLQGALTLGDLMMFLAYLLMLLEPLAVLAQSSAQFQNGLSALDRVLDLLAEPVEMLPSRGRRPLNRSSVRGRIELQDVWFRYPEQPLWALQAVT